MKSKSDLRCRFRWRLERIVIMIIIMTMVVIIIIMIIKKKRMHVTVDNAAKQLTAGLCREGIAN